MLRIFDDALSPFDNGRPIVTQSFEWVGSQFRHSEHPGRSPRRPTLSMSPPRRSAITASRRPATLSGSTGQSIGCSTGSTRWTAPSPASSAFNSHRALIAVTQAAPPPPRRPVVVLGCLPVRAARRGRVDRRRGPKLHRVLDRSHPQSIPAHTLSDDRRARSAGPPNPALLRAAGESIQPDGESPSRHGECQPSELRRRRPSGNWRGS